MSDKKQFVSVIIPTFNRADDLRRCIDSILQQLYKDFEILVVDNGSTDETAELLRKYPVRVILDTTKSVTHLFNTGWRNAQGEIIAFINDDAAAEPTWLKNIMATFEKLKDAGAVGGPTIVPEDLMNNQEMLRLHEASKHSILFKIPAWIYERVIMDGKYDEIGILCESGAYTVGGSLKECRELAHPIYVDLLTITNVAIKRTVLEEVNGLDEDFIWTHGDGDLFIRIKEAGHKLVFDPKVVVWHYVNPSGDTRSAYWRGRDYALFLLKSVRPKSWRGRGKMVLNVFTLNTYWVYKALATMKGSYLRGIQGFVKGVLAYILGEQKGEKE